MHCCALEASHLISPCVHSGQGAGCKRQGVILVQHHLRSLATARALRKTSERGGCIISCSLHTGWRLVLSTESSIVTSVGKGIQYVTFAARRLQPPKLKQVHAMTPSCLSGYRGWKVASVGFVGVTDKCVIMAGKHPDGVPGAQWSTAAQRRRRPAASIHSLTCISSLPGLVSET